VWMDASASFLLPLHERRSRTKPDSPLLPDTPQHSGSRRFSSSAGTAQNPDASLHWIGMCDDDDVCVVGCGSLSCIFLLHQLAHCIQPRLPSLVFHLPRREREARYSCTPPHHHSLASATYLRELFVTQNGRKFSLG